MAKKDAKKKPARPEKARAMAKRRMAPARAGEMKDDEVDRVAGGGYVTPGRKYLCTNE